MKHNYHSHTTWCNHASFTSETLIKLAIEHEYKTWGISEHIYSPYGHNKMSLENEENMYEYINELKDLKEKYKSKINVLIGFELDVVDQFSLEVPVDFINKIMANKDVDFVNAGYHVYSDSKSTYTTKTTPKYLEEVLKNWEILFSKTKVRYIAHPCAFVEGNGKWEEWMAPYVEKMAKLAKKYDVVLGLNVNGIYKKRLYPCPEFWAIVGKVGTKSILELDAHSSGPLNGNHVANAKALAKDCNLNLIDKLWQFGKI